MTVVMPIAPWVFGAGATAYAVLPALMSEHVTQAPVAFSALMCLVALGVGFGVQHAGRRVVGDGIGGVVAALVLLVAGMAMATWAATVLTVWVALPAAAVLGAGAAVPSGASSRPYVRATPCVKTIRGAM